MKKTILISGGAEGLGRALAEKLSKDNKVVILVREAEKAAKAAGEIGCDFVLGDVSDYGQIEAAVNEVVQKNGGIDILINNAGQWIQGPLEASDPARIKSLIEANTLGTILLTRAVLPHMKSIGKGRIVNIISQAGLTAKAERSVYNASKWAITGFTKCLQLELVHTGVTVSGLYPGPMKSNLFVNAGVEKDVSKALDLPEVVRAVEFIIETPENISIPELGINPDDY